MAGENASDDAIKIELFLEVYETFGIHGKPAIRISKFLSKREDVEYILKQALNDKPIIAQITLKNKMLVVPKLARLGLIDPTQL